MARGTMIARMGGLTSATAKRQMAERRKKARAKRSVAGEHETDERLEQLEAELERAEADKRAKRLEQHGDVVTELMQEMDATTRAPQAAPDPDELADVPGVSGCWLRFAQRCRRFEAGSGFQTFIIIVILLASILVGVNTYETDSDGLPLLSADAVAVLDVIDSVILAIFWAEIGMKIAGEGKTPWQFFCNAWCACRALLAASARRCCSEWSPCQPLILSLLCVAGTSSIL